MINYKQKYLKYKTKYLKYKHNTLSKIQSGGIYDKDYFVVFDKQHLITIKYHFLPEEVLFTHKFARPTTYTLVVKVSEAQDEITILGHETLEQYDINRFNNDTYVGSFHMFKKTYKLSQEKHVSGQLIYDSLDNIPPANKPQKIMVSFPKSTLLNYEVMVYDYEVDPNRNLEAHIPKMREIPFYPQKMPHMRVMEYIEPNNMLSNYKSSTISQRLQTLEDRKKFLMAIQEALLVASRRRYYWKTILQPSDIAMIDKKLGTTTKLCIQFINWDNFVKGTSLGEFNKNIKSTNNKINSNETHIFTCDTPIPGVTKGMPIANMDIRTISAFNTLCIFILVYLLSISNISLMKVLPYAKSAPPVENNCKQIYTLYFPDGQREYYNHASLKESMTKFLFGTIPPNDDPFYKNLMIILHNLFTDMNHNETTELYLQKLRIDE